MAATIASCAIAHPTPQLAVRVCPTGTEAESSPSMLFAWTDVTGQQHRQGARLRLTNSLCRRLTFVHCLLST
eukprot:scaffold1500_cov398-Prasinococcus_capsulatus_cf.AAC.4